MALGLVINWTTHYWLDRKPQHANWIMAGGISFHSIYSAIKMLFPSKIVAF